MDFYFPTNVLKPEDYAPVQVLALKDYYKNYFNNIMEEIGIDKTKRIFMDEFSKNILNILLTSDDFEKMNFDKSKIHIIDLDKSFYNLDKLKEETVIYIIQPNKEIFANILESYFLISSKFQGVETNLIFIPGESYEIIEIMMGNDLINKFKIYSLSIDLFPIDNDLLSLEKENCFREIYIEKDLTSIGELANAFVKLESCFGIAKHSYIKGDNAKIFENLVREKEKENNLKNANEVLGMIVLDRNIDFLTTLTANYTYEGLIDDFFGINVSLNSIKIKESLIKDLSKIKKKRDDTKDNLVTFHLASYMNNFYSRIACMHYLDAKIYVTKIHNYYSDMAKGDRLGKRQTTEQLKNTTTELQTYMKELKEPISENENILEHIFNNLSNPMHKEYIDHAEILLTGILPPNLHLYYEDYISDKKDLHQILKLMAIECLTQGGIKDYNELKRDILNIYGYQNIFLFRDLEHLGWLKEKKMMTNLMMDVGYDKVLEKLKLCESDNSSKQIKDCSYLMKGFCPLSLKLIEKAVEGQWNKIQEILVKMPGEVSFPINENEIIKPTKEVNTIFLVFIGGVTYNEIEGVRFLNRKFKEAYDKSKSKKPTRLQLIIVTTGIINSKKIFKNLGKMFKTFYSMKQFHEQATKDK